MQDDSETDLIDLIYDIAPDEKPFIRVGTVSLVERAKSWLWLHTGWPKMDLETGDWA